MTLLARAFSRTIGILLMLALALLGLGVALYCLDALVGLGAARPDRVLDLPNVRSGTGRFLAQVAAPGVTAGLALLCGLGTVTLGMLLLVGLLRSRRRRVAVMERHGDGGRLAAKPGPLRDMARALAQQTPATAVQRPRLALSRNGDRGRMTLCATRPRTTEAATLRRALEESLRPISEPFGLKPRIRVREATQGERAK